jgi:hypothetical protein
MRRIDKYSKQKVNASEIKFCCSSGSSVEPHIKMTLRHRCHNRARLHDRSTTHTTHSSTPHRDEKEDLSLTSQISSEKP